MCGPEWHVGCSVCVSVCVRACVHTHVCVDLTSGIDKLTVVLGMILIVKMLLIEE